MSARIGPASLVCTAVLLGHVLAAHAADDGVEVRIDTVLASNSGRAFDSALVALKPPLDRMFQYSSYRLIQGERRVINWRRAERFMLPGGRYLVVSPSGLSGDRVHLNVMLIHGTRPLVNTELKLKNRGTFLVGGPQYKEGVLIIAIGASTRSVPTVRTAVAAEPAAATR